MLNIKKLLTKILEWINNPIVTSSGEAGFTAKNTGTNGAEIMMGVGASGTLHGIYSRNRNSWIICSDSSTNKIYLGGNASTGLNVSSAAEARSSIGAQATLIDSAITVNTSTGTGTFVGGVCHRYGKVVHLTFQFRNTASVASGSDIYSGTLSSSVPAPISPVTSSTYYGGHAIVGILNTAKELTIRNASPTAVQYGASNTGTISFTYICS